MRNSWEYMLFDLAVVVAACTSELLVSVRWTGKGKVIPVQAMKAHRIVRG
jgi:hypothetical protein